MNKNSEYYYRKMWSNATSPYHAHNDSNWFDKYFDEMFFLIKDNITKDSVIIDAGCGSGEFLVRLSPYCSKVYGIDFSDSLVKKSSKLIEELKISNATVYHSNILDIDLCKFEISPHIIVSNGVVQHLSYEELKSFISKCTRILQTNGVLLIMNIPNFNLKDLYNIRFYKRNQKLTSYQIFKEIIKFHWSIWKEKIKNPKYHYDDGIGNWYTFEEVEKIAQENNLSLEFFYSIYPPYGYRFHAKLIKP